MKQLIPWICVGWVLMGLPWGARAQDDSAFYAIPRYLLSTDDIQPNPEAEIAKVVAASRSVQTLEELPFRIHIITREEIIRNGYKTLVDVMRMVPGMKVSQPGSAESGELFLMRGLIGNDYCKILLNNQPLQPSVSGSLPISAQLPIRQAERIEVIYGPAAAMYGADAAVGVINIILEETERTNYAQGDIEIGVDGYRYLNFTVGGKLGKNKNILKYSFYGNRGERRNIDLNIKDRSDYNPLVYLSKFSGIPLEDVVIGPSPRDTAAFIDRIYQPFYQGSLTWPRIGDLPQESRLLGVQLNFRGIKFGFENMYRRDHSAIGRNPFLFSYAEPNTYLGETIQRISLGYAHEGKRFASTTQALYLRYRLDPNSSFGINYLGGNENGRAFSYLASDDLLIEQIINFKLLDVLDVVSGATFKLSGNLPATNDLAERFDAGDYGPFRRQELPPHPLFGQFGQNPITYFNLAGFMQLQAQLKRWNFLASLRYDYNSRYGSTFNPRLAALWHMGKNTQLYASFGRAFRAPSPYLAYNSVASRAYTEQREIIDDSIFYEVIPNPDLQPETFEAYEVGIRQQLNDNFELNASFYRNEVQNLISYTISDLDPMVYPAAANGRARKPLNSLGASARLQGFQLSVSWKELIPAIKLGTAYHFTRGNGRETLPQTDQQQQQLETIDVLRMTPRNLHQWRIFAEPTRDVYLNLEQRWASDWVIRSLSTSEDIDNERFQNDRYYVLDALLGYKLGSQIRVRLEVTNVFNAAFSGIGATGLDIDSYINPQPRRRFVLGIDFNM